MHSLIVGLTRQGKTTLAQKLAKEFQKLGYKVGVFTVPGSLTGGPDPRWLGCCDFITLDRAKFLERFWDSQKVMWFVDECNRTVGKYDPEMEATATSGSLRGHTVHYIAQRTQTFNKTVREQCTRVYMFRLGFDDAKELSRLYGQSAASLGYELGKGQYFFFTTSKGSLRELDLGLVPGQRPVLNLGRQHDREADSKTSQVAGPHAIPIRDDRRGASRNRLPLGDGKKRAQRIPRGTA